MKTVAASALILVLLTSAAGAAVTTYNIALICGFDIDQYCKTIPRKRIRDLRACLAQHEQDLFPRCQDHYKDAK